MSILVFPLTKSREHLALMPEWNRKSAKNSIGDMPTIYLAIDGDEKTTEETSAAVGFRYRRQSHSCELTYWHGTDPQLLDAALQACIMQAILEGRKRLEIFNEVAWNELPVEQQPKNHSPYKRGGEMFNKALEAAGWVYEGEHKLWTKLFEDVKVWSYIPLEEGLPKLIADTTYVLGQNERVQHYREKNIELYVKDRDYYSHTSGRATESKTFAEHLQDQYDWVTSQPNVSVFANWPEGI